MNYFGNMEKTNTEAKVITKPDGCNCKWENIKNEDTLNEQNKYENKKTELYNKKTFTQNKCGKNICSKSEGYKSEGYKNKKNISSFIEAITYAKRNMIIDTFMKIKKYFKIRRKFVCANWLNLNQQSLTTFCAETLSFQNKEEKENEETEKNKQCINVDKQNNGLKFDIFVEKENAINSIISSTFAGIISRTLTAPLDRVKYIMQITNNLSIYEIFEIIKKDGNITGFFRGNYVNIIKIVPELSIKMYSYEFLKINTYKYYYQKNNINYKNGEVIDIPFFFRFLIGSSSGMIAALCIYPLEIVKTRLIVSNQITNCGIIQCVRDIYKKEKLRNFYNGLSLHMYGVIFFSGCNMSIYDYLKYLFFSFYKNYIHLNYCLKNKAEIKVEQCPNEKNKKNLKSNESDCTNLIHVDPTVDLKNDTTDEVKLLNNTLGKKSNSLKDTIEMSEEGNPNNSTKGKGLFTNSKFLNANYFIKLYNSKNSKYMNELNVKNNVEKKEGSDGSDGSDSHLYYNTQNMENSYNFQKQTGNNLLNSNPMNSNIANGNITNGNCSYCDYRIKNVNCFLFLFFGMTSSFIAQIVSYPFLVLRTRMQTLNNEITTNYLNSERKKIKSCSFIIYNIKMYGFRSLYRGIYVNLLKTIPATSITWFSYEFSMRKLQNM